VIGRTSVGSVLCLTHICVVGVVRPIAGHWRFRGARLNVIRTRTDVGAGHVSGYVMIATNPVV